MLGRSANSLCNLAAAEFAERPEFVSMSFNLALYKNQQNNYHRTSIVVGDNPHHVFFCTDS
jgi:hypothetical protein